ncbi:MAG: hypothetical protein ABI877_15600, partial [Gemmatimonadaceae bacterium]
MFTNRLCLVLGLAALGVGAGSSNALGQMPGGASSRPIRLVVSGGLTLPAGDLKDTHDSGFHYDASLLLNIAGIPLTLRPEVTLTRFTLKDPTTQTTSGYGGSGDVTQMLGALGNIELPLGGGLYAIAGGGVLNLKTPTSGASSPDISQSKLTFDAGAGLRFHLGGIGGFVEARVGTASYDQGKFGYSKATFIPIT